MLGKKLIRFVVCVIFLLAHSAFGAEWTDCSGNTTTNTSVSAKGRICYTFTDATDSSAFTIFAGSALVCLDPNTATEGAANAQVNIRFCHLGSKPSSNPQNQCITTLATPLTGATGNACERFGPGVHYIDVTTSAGGNSAVVSILGE